MEDEIQDAYLDTKNPGSYTGLFNFYQTNKFVGKKKVASALQKVKGYRLHFPANKKIPRRFVYVPSINNQFGMDLIDIQKYSKSNYGKRYILAVVSFFSKMAWIEPIKDKTMVQVRDALERILTRAGVKPAYLQSDDGTEFMGSAMKKYCQDNNINQFTTNSPLKVTYVERYIRSIRQRIQRYMTHNKTKRFVHKLRDFEKGYQNSYHRAIGTTPSLVNQENESEIWDRLYSGKRRKKSLNQLKVGSKVNIKLAKSTFTKGYEVNFEDSEYEVEQVMPTNPTTYKVKAVDGTILERRFYRQELVPLD